MEDLNNGISDSWCKQEGLPLYRGILHILSPQKQQWRAQVAQWAKKPTAFYNEFHELRIFLTRNMPFVTDQANEEKIKPFKKKFPHQTMLNTDSLTWKVIGSLNKHITSELIPKYNPREYKLFRRYDNPFAHSKRAKVTPPTAHCSLSSSSEESNHSFFFQPGPRNTGIQ